MFEARWQNNEEFACYSNTLSGAIELLLAFVPEDEAGCIYVYENGTLKGLVPVPGWLTSLGGVVDMVGASDLSMFDIRRVLEKLGSNAIQWYYNEVITYNGEQVLPVMR